MDFRPEDYYQAALERRDEARAALSRGDFALAMWVAGVSVECVLRAYRSRIDPEFDARHNVPELFQQSGLKSIIEADARDRGRSEETILRKLQQIRADVNAVGRLWSNNYRYASSRRLKAHLKSAGLSVGIKGDFLKENARKLVEAAAAIVAEGQRLWVSSGRRS